MGKKNNNSRRRFVDIGLTRTCCCGSSARDRPTFPLQLLRGVKSVVVYKRLQEKNPGIKSGLGRPTRVNPQ